MLTTGFSSVAPVTSRAAPSSLFILASSVCKSFKYLISALTEGGEGGHLFRLTFSVVLWGGRNTANKHCMCGDCLQCMDHTGFAPSHWVYTLRLQGALQALSKGGPAFCALPRSKPLRFSGTPQGHRLGWACILCPSRV